MEYIPVVMVRRSLANLPRFPLPPGYRFRTYRKGDEGLWAEIEASVGEFATAQQALTHFRSEFGAALNLMESRCFFLETVDGRAIGTATAWMDHAFYGQEYGRLHWVAIHPDFQGRGLGKPLVAQAMERLARSHTRAYLTSQTTSARAIGIYLDFGFEPMLVTERWEEAWALLARELRHPALAQFLRSEGQ